jgi:hypothetical protein
MMTRHASQQVCGCAREPVGEKLGNIQKKLGNIPTRHFLAPDDPRAYVCAHHVVVVVVGTSYNIAYTYT